MTYPTIDSAILELRPVGPLLQEPTGSPNFSFRAAGCRRPHGNDLCSKDGGRGGQYEIARLKPATHIVDGDLTDESVVRTGREFFAYHIQRAFFVSDELELHDDPLYFSRTFESPVALAWRVLVAEFTQAGGSRGLLGAIMPNMPHASTRAWLSARRQQFLMSVFGQPVKPGGSIQEYVFLIIANVSNLHRLWIERGGCYLRCRQARIEAKSFGSTQALPGMQGN